ncbi:2-C-methyl-D-erythritol 2,4-cyclodiphosphate synthase [Helicobacter trogontum]|uniref:2-C-methyl-D-erythritol 2,4-cyclodiphosphate synthase n=1 Tax=Helicobacter trogontum TaxID=50960 RepID=A0A4U8S6G7_9HELI|nr:2-C-methyl-D-erythritol 2,4-cyclodiphosphate synthase [Helicobacter trogontum]TLD81440.1 2-C-methyl-D-erythritol 2,4-cyclodiphosphate synthase [Helicobacter trogontum]
MKDITLIIMAAGDSVRFCNSMIKDTPHINSMDSHNTLHHNETRIIESTNKPSTKKQWLRLGTTPLWYFVTQNLASQIIEICNTLQQTSNIAYCKDDHDTKCNNKQSETNLDTPTNIQHSSDTQNLTRFSHNQTPLKKIIITASPKDISYMQKLISNTLYFTIENKAYAIPLQIVCGGNTRFQSLKNAVQHVESTHIIVNDCARFNTKKHVLHNLLSLFMNDDFDCIVPYLQVSDTTLHYDSYTNTHSAIPRENLKLIQTPQITKTKKILESFTKGVDFSDESSAICALKSPKIGFVVGSKDMAKLTYYDDLHLLKKLYHANAHTRHDTLIGHGSDIHGFIDSKDMYLCGVRIESHFGFKAHSDGDVAIHAIIDSILGAMNYGDIGELFPDNKEEFKDIDSKILLKEVYEYCLSVGLEITNLDVTIIAQTPRISPYKAQMQETLAHILYLPKMCINIKASTAESLGFIGRKEGVLANSIVQLRARKFH